MVAALHSGRMAALQMRAMAQPGARAEGDAVVSLVLREFVQLATIR